MNDLFLFLDDDNVASYSTQENSLQVLNEMKDKAGCF